MVKENNKARDLQRLSVFVFISSMLLVVLLIQLNGEFTTFAYESKGLEDVSSEDGQICPVQSECDRPNDNGTDVHNVTERVTIPPKSDNESGLVAGSIMNDSNRSESANSLADNMLLDNVTTNSFQNMINITTDKQAYNAGELINIVVKNMGQEQLLFPNSALGLTIRNLASNELYPILSSQIIVILNPGDSKSLQWDQVGINGNQAPSGNYSASVSSGINSAATTFTIK